MPALGPSRFWRYRYNKNVAHAALPEFESCGTVEDRRRGVKPVHCVLRGKVRVAA